ncbi:MAG TPA: ceramide glucosyltransferase, partial [Polyangiaceae bacterium]|nr:ceramide glucosyltransferase [Polyangiaceae bacterium]
MPIAVGLTAASFVLYAAMMCIFVGAMLRRPRKRAPTPARAPRVTIFKPLAGRDDDLEANLDSFARIDYPSFEVLLGVASLSDPAYAEACRFVGRHPQL